MSDETKPHGGARQRAGRPKGSKNKVPSKSIRAQEEFAELIRPELENYFRVLDGIAKNGALAPKDRIAAVKELLDRALGKPREIIEIDKAGDQPTIDDMLELWKQDESQ